MNDENTYCEDCISPPSDIDIPAIIAENIKLQNDAIGACCNKLADEIEKGLIESGKPLERVCKKAEKCANKQASECCSSVSNVIESLEASILNIVTEQKIQMDILTSNISNLVSNTSSIVNNITNTSNTTNITEGGQPGYVNVDVDVDSPVTVNVTGQSYEPTDINSVLNFIVEELSYLRRCCEDKKDTDLRPVWERLAKLEACCEIKPYQPPDINIDVDVNIKNILPKLPPPPPPPLQNDSPIVLVPITLNVSQFNEQTVNVDVSPTPVSIEFMPTTNVEVVNNLNFPRRNPPADKEPTDDKPTDKDAKDEDEVKKIEAPLSTTLSGARFNDVADMGKDFPAWRWGDATSAWRAKAADMMRLPHLATVTDFVDLVNTRHALERQPRRQQGQ